MADKRKIREFVKRWTGRGYEKGEAVSFWKDLLYALEYQQWNDPECILYEHHLASGGYIDAWLRDASTIVEQKTLDIDLDKPESRQGMMKTPLVQALDYVEELPRSEQPRFVVTCNFSTFRVYDRDAWSKSQLVSHPFEFRLSDLVDHPEYLSFITDPANSRLEKEKEVSIRAGELIGKLYDRMREGYINPDSDDSMHALNVLCVRLVFCLFCEDADLFPKDAFLHYLKDVSPENIRTSLKRLFRALDTPHEERDPYDTTVKPFPYVNGGLFKEKTEIPNFDVEMKRFLLEEVSAAVDWSKISPTIFGGIFESTLNPHTRRAGGMHYTSPENIHKVIDPLFLDDLKNEFSVIRDTEGLTPRQRNNRYQVLHDKLCSLTFFDPACGSGNFLTETYIHLRRLEDLLLRELQGGQTGLGFEGEALGQRVRLSQFYGIEINDFAVTVAQTALWISRLKANGETDMLLSMGDDDFPLHEAAHIVHGNALRMDWNEVLPADECSFILGNPPFYGARLQSKQQKAEIKDVFHSSKNSGNIDYVAGWYIKAAEYMGNCPIRAAFVSTNSICQGEQVANIWKPIYDLGVRIDFAHDTFRWRNEATEQAHVFVVIVGFSKQGGTKTLFHHATPDAPEEVLNPANINAYLLNAPDVFVWNRNTPLCDVPEISIGNKPIDGGNYLFNEDEKEAFLSIEPKAAPYFHRWLGSKEFLNNQSRYVLWLGDLSEEELVELPQCRERVENVRQLRLASKSAPTQKIANIPARFHVENMPEGTSVLIPEVSSERRRYIPMGFIGPETFCSSLVRLIPNASIYHYGVLQSQFHNAWMRTVAGRLKSDYRYSGGIVYNNFVWPNPTSKQREAIEVCGQTVLDIRDNYPDESLANLYDPEKMPADLLAAHKALDAAVEAAYGVNFDGDEEKIVTHLFKLFAEATA
jgi:hypothetical protein